MNFADQLLRLSKTASEMAFESEEHRDISPELYDQAKQLGLFRLLLPENLGGCGKSLVEWFEVVEELSCSDGSFGWIVGHGSVSSSIVNSTANETFADFFFRQNRFTVAWSNMAGDEATQTDDGVTINSRWRWITASSHADYLGGSVRLKSTNGSGTEKIVSVLVPREKAHLDRVWDTVGLAASGSHDVIIKNTTVPAQEVLNWPQPIDSKQMGHPNENGLSDKPWSILASGVWPFSICCAVTQLGLAKRAIQEIRQELFTRKNWLTGAHATDQTHILHKIETAEATYSLCRRALKSVLSDVWEQACQGTNPDKDLLTEIRLISVETTRKSRQIVADSFDLMGTRGIAKNNIFQKLYRDASCLTSHMSVNEASFVVTGQARYERGNAKWL